MRKLHFTGIVAVATVFLFVTNLDARTWYVKPDGTGDAPTVQAGIDSAAAADTVMLACGTFNEHGLVMKSNICLIGETPMPPCVTIDAQQQGNLITCSLTGYSTLIQSITFKNASPEAMNINGWVTVRDCIFANNANPTVDIHYTPPEFYNCVFYGNGLSDPTPDATIFGVYAGTDPLFKNCTFVNNYWGISLGMDATARVENCIIAGCQVGSLAAGAMSWFTTISCTDFFDNGNVLNDSTIVNSRPSCFIADPQFCGIPGSGNFYLQNDSPCAPGNHPNGSACSTIGALPVLCGSVKTESRTWGSVKALYGP